MRLTGKRTPATEETKRCAANHLRYTGMPSYWLPWSHRMDLCIRFVQKLTHPRPKVLVLHRHELPGVINKIRREIERTIAFVEASPCN